MRKELKFGGVGGGIPELGTNTRPQGKLVSSHHADPQRLQPPRVVSRRALSPGTQAHLVKGVLEGRSGTCPECSRGNSDIKNRRGAPSFCAGSSAQACRHAVGSRRITSFLIDTP